MLSVSIMLGLNFFGIMLMLALLGHRELHEYAWLWRQSQFDGVSEVVHRTPRGS